MDNHINLPPYSKWHEDPSHAWLQVRITDFRRLGILYDISSYSYCAHDTWAFLEEDCDAHKFIQALEKNNEPFDPLPINTLNQDHWIRTLPSISTIQIHYHDDNDIDSMELFYPQHERSD